MKHTSIAGIDQYRDLVQDVGHQAVKGLHPVSIEQEITIDVEITAVVARNLCAKGFENLRLIQVFGDPIELCIAKTVPFAGLTNIIWILTGALIRSQNSVVAVYGCGHAGPDTTTVVTALDERLTARKGIVHGLASTLIHDSWPAAVTTSHGPVGRVLRQAICKAIAYHDRLQVDVCLLVLLDLGGEDWNIMTSVRFASNMEVLGRVFREGLEEERE